MVNTANQAPQNIPWWQRLRSLLILAFVLSAVVPLSIVTLITLNEAARQAEAQVINQLESVTSLKQAQIENWLVDMGNAVDLFMVGDRGQRLTALTQQSNLAPLDPEEVNIVNSALAQAVAAEPLFEELFIYNISEGRIIAASNPLNVDQFVTTQPYYSASLNGEDFIQKPFREFASNQIVMYLTHPLNTGEGIVGILAAKLNLDILNSVMLNRTGLGQTGETYLISRESNTFLTPSRYESPEFPPDGSYNSLGIEAALNAQSGSGIYPDYRGVPVLGVYRWIPSLDAALLAEIDTAEALQINQQLQQTAIFVVFITALIAIIIGIVVANRIAYPLTRLTTVATSIANGNLNRRADLSTRNEIGVLAQAFNSMADQLQALVQSLEDRVASRAARMETMANISGRISSILEIDKLTQSVVTQIQTEFNYYHTHIYLLDNESGNLVVAYGAGQAGEIMRQEGHAIPLGKAHSLVARAARSGQVIWVNNVREDENWLPNPLLPHTYSEMAVPIILGGSGQVVGVLDVQEDSVGALDQSDASILRYLANQLAVAIFNARQFEAVEQALAEAQQLQQRYTQQAWRSDNLPSQQLERLYTSPSSPPLPAQIFTQADQLAQAHQIDPTPLPPEALTADIDTPLSLNQSLVAPLTLRDQAIGTLQLYQLKNSEADQAPPWSEQDLALVNEVLEQVAQMAENLRLFEQTRRRADYERLLGDITQQIRQAPDFDTLARTTTQNLSNVLGASLAAIQLDIGHPYAQPKPKTSPPNGEQNPHA